MPALDANPHGLRFEGSYVDDVRDGKFIEKDRNGNIIKQGYYESGLRYEE